MYLETCVITRTVWSLRGGTVIRHASTRIPLPYQGEERWEPFAMGWKFLSNLIDAVGVYTRPSLHKRTFVIRVRCPIG